MATIKIERGLHLGTAYAPDMQQSTKKPEATWSTLREQVRDAESFGYDTVVAVDATGAAVETVQAAPISPRVGRSWRSARPMALRRWH